MAAIEHLPGMCDEREETETERAGCRLQAANIDNIANIEKLQQLSRVWKPGDELIRAPTVQGKQNLGTPSRTVLFPLLLLGLLLLVVNAQLHHILRSLH